jgi:hypothetical protein
MTFAQFVAEQDARNTVQLNVTKWCYMLIDALKQNYMDYSIRGHQRQLLNMVEIVVTYLMHLIIRNRLKN